MAGWHHWLYGCESEWTLGVGDGQGGLACCDSWGREESDMAERLNWTELIHTVELQKSEDHLISQGLPQWLSSKESDHNAGDAGNAGWIPGSGRFPGGGHSNALQYSCLENPMDRGAWQATVHRVTKSRTQLGNWACKHKFVIFPLFFYFCWLVMACSIKMTELAVRPREHH